MSAPNHYCGTPVPSHIQTAWDRWEGAAWRTIRHAETLIDHPADQRFTVRAPDGMCTTHLTLWREARDHSFDPRTGDRWPGGGGTPFTILGDVARAREERRREWDEKAAAQMQLIEQICLRGDSRQCAPKPACVDLVQLPLFDLETAP
ncbi:MULTISPECIES: hypothetical protein [unclassified Nocardiopsis]|uniref:hypothetical protein n=1 Tax=Nocardiopsis TaxID=2013 RepID=UPI00387B3FB4